MLATITFGGVFGGIEKNVAVIANSLFKSGRRVTVLSFDLPEASSNFNLETGIDWLRVGRSPPHGSITLFDRIQMTSEIRRAIRRHKIKYIICFHHGILFRILSAILFMNLKVYVSERQSPQMYDHISRSKFNINSLLLLFVNKIVIQFDEYRRFYPSILHNKIQTIPNYVEIPNNYVVKTGESSTDRKWLLFIGRLSYQKNVDTLLKAFSTTKYLECNWGLRIVGAGELRPKIIDIIESLDLTSHVEMIEPCQQVSRFYIDSTAFCLPSRWEGFPNVLAEAMAHGLPVVGFARCSGVNSLVIHEHNGLLAEGEFDIMSLSNVLNRIFNSDSLRTALGFNARESMQVYSQSDILSAWSKLIER